MKRRETHVLPMVRRKKLGSGADRSKGIFLTSLRATQFALERAVKDIATLKTQFDGLAKLNKEMEIAINRLGLQLNRLRDRLERSDAE